jgi:hypothetical protein
VTLSRVSSVGLLIVCALAVGGCGMKGPPLAPLQRVPAAAGDVSATRFDQDVFIRFTVPNTNIEGIGIATLERVEVYGITLDAPLGQREAQTEAVRKAATLISSQHVRVPLPPPDPEKPAPPPIPQEPGLDQGGPAVAHERLTPEMRTPVEVSTLLPPPSANEVAPAADEPIIAAAPTFVPEEATSVRRYYFVVGVTRTGRYGQAAPPIAVPLSSASSATSAPAVAYDERRVTIKWSPAADARVGPVASADVLPSRPLAPLSPPTRYDVFAVSTSAPAADGVPIAPTPLNEAPLTTTQHVVQGVKFGAEQCFAVSPVDTIATVVVRGPMSAPTCHTPRDTFPPAAPSSLAAVAGAGSISLIWEPNTEGDLAGYMVLRGEVGSDRLTPLTTAPIRETTFRDTTVRAGTRYVYAVVAVDNASPANSSPESARVEETARQ